MLLSNPTLPPSHMWVPCCACFPVVLLQSCAGWGVAAAGRHTAQRLLNYGAQAETCLLLHKGQHDILTCCAQHLLAAWRGFVKMPGLLLLPGMVVYIAGDSS
jgi:hypothetical protein